MEITTIVGIVVAVIIILAGLVMLLRKPKDVAPSLESDLHINAESNQPVIPRHVRDQLKAEAKSADLQAQTRVEPNLKDLERVEVADEKQQKIEETTQASPRVHSSESVSPVVVDSAKEPQNIQNVVDTKAEGQIEVPVKVDSTDKTETASDSSQPLTSQTTSETVAEVKEEDFQLNPLVESAVIKEFDEESGLLDVHLIAQQKNDDESSLSTAETIIALYVYPSSRKVLSGDKTLKMLLKYGLRFGELSCFHRYENPEEESHLLFSVLRMTENGPEGFDLETLSAEQVHGLAFFLALPHSDVQKGFDTMVSIAGLIAREIDGTVYDENNLEFTPQLKEHWRHKAIDYRVGQEV